MLRQAERGHRCGKLSKLPAQPHAPLFAASVNDELAGGQEGGLRGGTETGVDARNVNAGFLRAEGIDIKAAYRFNLMDDVRLTFDINATRVLKSWIRSTDLSPILKCEGLAGKTCLRPQPKWVFVQTSTLEYGPATMQLRWRYIGKVTNDLVGFGVGQFVIGPLSGRK